MTKIQAAIKESMPNWAAEEMKLFIEQAQHNEVALKALEELGTKHLKELEELRRQQAAFKNTEQVLKKAEELMATVEVKERKLALDFKDEQLKQRDYVIQHFYNALALLVKNPRAIEMISEFSNGMLPVKDQYGANSSQPTTGNISGTREKKEEKD